MNMTVALTELAGSVICTALAAGTPEVFTAYCVPLTATPEAATTVHGTLDTAPPPPGQVVYEAVAPDVPVTKHNPLDVGATPL